MNPSDSTKEYIIMSESLVSSILKDVVTFGILIGGLFVNYYYLGNSTFLKVFWVFLFIVLADKFTNKHFHRFNNVEDAIKYLESKEEGI